MIVPFGGARRHAAGLLLVVCCLLPSSGSAAILPSLPEDDPSIPLLSRLDGSGTCRLPDRAPWPGEAVLACLDGIDTAALDAVDRGLVAALRARLDLRSGFPAGWGARPAWETRHDDRVDRLFLDLAAEGHLAAVPDSTGGSSGLAGGRIRPRVEVLLGDRLALWARPTMLTELSNRARWTKVLEPRSGTYQTVLFTEPGTPGKARTVDALEGGIEAEVVGVRLRTGLLRTRWGPLAEPLMFSGSADPMALTEASTRIGPIEATVLGARLTGDTFAERRYLYGHRFRWVGSTWSASWSEAAVSVDRDLELLYLVPVFPFINTEHRLGDPDNRQMDFDVSWRPVPRLALSAELFLDDLQNLLGFLDDGWGNKWALGAAATVRDLTGRRTLDRLQVSRIEPWTGGSSSAILPGASRNLPVHFGKPLGSALGPNSLSILWDRRQDLSQRWCWTSQARLEWKGTGPGSSVDDLNWRDSSGTWVTAHPTKRWLSGAIVGRQLLATGAELRFARQWRAAARAGVESSDVDDERRYWPVLSCEVLFRE